MRVNRLQKVRIIKRKQTESNRLDTMNQKASAFLLFWRCCCCCSFYFFCFYFFFDVVYSILPEVGGLVKQSGQESVIKIRVHSMDGWFLNEGWMTAKQDKIELGILTRYYGWYKAFFRNYTIVENVSCLSLFQRT